MKKTTTVGSLLGVLLFSITPALAQASGGFSIVPYGDEATPAAPVVVYKPSITPQVGQDRTTTPKEVKVDAVNGFGNNIPLNIALKQIIPGSKKIIYSSDVDQNTKISWVSGPYWNTTLSSSLKKIGLTSVDVNNNVTISKIEVAKPIVKPVEQPVISEAPKAQSDKINCLTPKPVVVSRKSYLPEHHLANSSAKPEKVVPTVWHVQVGDTLAVTLEKWATLAGWKVSYPIEYVYPMQVSTDFNGSFTDAAGSLINSVQANPLPYICLHTSTKIAEVSLSPDCSTQPVGAQ